MFTVRGSPQQIDYARQLVEEKIGVWSFLFKMVPIRMLWSFDSFTNSNGGFFRDQLLQSVVHMALLDPMEVQAHMDHLVLPGRQWVHTTQDHTTRDLQGLSMQSCFVS